MSGNTIDGSILDLYTLRRPERRTARPVTIPHRETPTRTVELRTADDWLNAVKTGIVPWPFVRDNEDNITGETPDNDAREDFETILELAVNSQGGASFK